MALRLWTEHATWFSGEEHRKGQIKVGQLADLMVPSADYFTCPEDEIAALTSDLTLVGGKTVYAAGAFAALDQNPPPPAMPDWSPVREFGGYGAWRAQTPHTSVAARPLGPASHAQACALHGHQHAAQWSAALPVADAQSFWGALGCACWAI